MENMRTHQGIRLACMLAPSNLQSLFLLLFCLPSSQRATKATTHVVVGGALHDRRREAVAHDGVERLRGHPAHAVERELDGPQAEVLHGLEQGLRREGLQQDRRDVQSPRHRQHAAAEPTGLRHGEDDQREGHHQAAASESVPAVEEVRQEVRAGDVQPCEHRHQRSDVYNQVYS